MLFIRRANKTYTTEMTWMILWGQRSKHQKIPRPQIYLPPPPKKKSHTELHDQNTRPPPRIFSYIKPPKIILAEFSYPKNPGIENFKPKKSFDHRRHLKSGVLPLGFCSTPSFFSERFAYDVLHNHKKDSQIRS